MRGLLLVLLGLLFCDLRGQPVFFNHITQANGLRNGNIRAIVKDHQGFVWIGTEDGLHRYDGYSMKVYRNNDNDSSSVSSNFIICLFEDSRKNLWIGTLDGGVCVYDRQHDHFRRFKLSEKGEDPGEHSVIRTIYEGSDHYLYVGFNGFSKTRLSHDLDSIHFENIPLPVDSNDKGEIKVLTITGSGDTDLLVGINAYGLFRYNCQSGKFTIHEVSQWEKNIQSVYVDKARNLLWVGSLRDGLVIYDPVRKRHIRLTTGTDGGSLRSNTVSAITADQSRNLWLGTEKGLSFIPQDCDPFSCRSIITYQPSESNLTSIHGSTIKVVYVDDRDKVWAGAYYEGINVYDKSALNFGTISIATPLMNGPINANVSAIEADSINNLWVGLDGGGLFLFQGTLDDTKAVTIEPIASCPQVDKIKAMKLDRDHNLWIGTWGNGLYLLNAKTRQCLPFTQVCPTVNIGKEIMSLETDDFGNLWIGTFDLGLFRYSLASHEIVKIKNDRPSPYAMDRINALFVDSGNTVWVGKIAGGLGYVRQGTADYVRILSPHINATVTISSLYKDRKGILWIGSPNQGLIAYNPDTKESRLFGESEGLANSVIYAIAEDKHERLWLSSNLGISLFEKESGKFTNFNAANGLSTNQFNRNSVARDQRGTLMFGSIRGLNFFMPDKFLKKKTDIKVAFTRFSLNNVEQLPGAPGSMLREDIATTPEIRLAYNQNSFSVEFAALNFNFTNQTVYSYQLKGFDPDWQFAATRRRVSYTNLAPGEYFLRLRASDDSSEWPTSYTELKLVIVPAWWQTNWFRVGLVISLTALVAAAYRLRIRYFVEQQKKLEQLVTIRTQKLNAANLLLNNRIEEINSINTVLNKQRNEIIEKNNEIQAQNEELTSQNEQIAEQHASLQRAETKLREINTLLEQMVDERTEKLQLTIDDLNKTVFELDRFVYSASHDLSAPLKSILGLINIIRMETDRDRLLEYIEYIRNSVIKLEGVIQSMVDFARNTHGVIESEEFNLHELVNDIISEFAFLPEATRVEYFNQVPADQRIQNDRHRIKVVLHNLIGNSIKYADRTKEQRWVRVECELATDYLKLRVTDNGIGIRKEYLDKVFNMYFRATETAKGSGLGLFIVKETLNKIGGTIRVESEVGVETVFEIRIPIS